MDTRECQINTDKINQKKSRLDILDIRTDTQNLNRINIESYPTEIFHAG
jgi:hypothetical protein